MNGKKAKRIRRVVRDLRPDLPKVDYILTETTKRYQISAKESNLTEDELLKMYIDPAGMTIRAMAHNHVTLGECQRNLYKSAKKEYLKSIR